MDQCYFQFQGDARESGSIGYPAVKSYLQMFGFRAYLHYDSRPRKASNHRDLFGFSILGASYESSL